MVDDREEQRRQKAYALWEEEGRPDGRHDAHWLQASDEDDGFDTEEAVTPDAGAAPDDAPEAGTIKPERPFEGS